MQGCKYAEHLKCKECTEVFHKKCKKFNLAHAHFLSRNIKPFLYKKVSETHKVAWSTDQNKLKSLAVKSALSVNSEIKKYTLSQVISLILSNQEVEGKVFYIECSQKVQGDIEKVKSVLTSFIEQQTINDSRVYVFISSVVNIKLEYPKI